MKIKMFLIGIFYLIPTIMLACLAVAELIIWNDDIELGFISLFGTFLLGLMCFNAFKMSIKKNNHTLDNNIATKNLLVQQKRSNEDMLKKELLNEELHYCPYCGKQVIEQWKYCYYCGKQIKE